MSSSCSFFNLFISDVIPQFWRRRKWRWSMHKKKQLPRCHTSSITNDTIIDMMVYLNQNQWYRTQIVLEKQNYVDIKTGVEKHRRHVIINKFDSKKYGLNDFSTGKHFTFRLFWWRKTVATPTPPTPTWKHCTESGRDLCCPKFSYTISYKFIGWTNSFRWEMVG